MVTENLRVRTSTFLVEPHPVVRPHKEPMGPSESEHNPWFVGVIQSAESQVLHTLVKAERGVPEDVKAERGVPEDGVM
jgi:hypothetical protein